MSIKHVLAAFEAKVGNPLRKLVLVKLADNANDEGKCWPSFNYLAEHCECSKRAIINHINALEEAGYLRKENRPGEKGNSSNIYHLSIEKGGANRSLPSANDSLGVVQDIHHPSADNSPPSENGSLPPSANDAPRTSHSLEPVNEPAKESRAGKGDKFVLPNWIDKTTWKEFEKHRRQLKKPMTDHAKTLAVGQLEKLTEKGYDANKLINHVILKGWQGFYEPSVEDRPGCMVEDYQTTQAYSYNPEMEF